MHKAERSTPDTLESIMSIKAISHHATFSKSIANTKTCTVKGKRKLEDLCEIPHFCFILFNVCKMWPSRGWNVFWTLLFGCYYVFCQKKCQGTELCIIHIVVCLNIAFLSRNNISGYSWATLPACFIIAGCFLYVCLCTLWPSADKRKRQPQTEFRNNDRTEVYLSERKSWDEETG